MRVNSFDAIKDLPGVAGTRYVNISAVQGTGAGEVDRLPYSSRVILENLLRCEDGRTVTVDHVRALVNRDHAASIPFSPERVLLQDASGIPVLADMVTLGQGAEVLGLDPATVTPSKRMDLVVDHALELDVAGTHDAELVNRRREYERHHDRYRFLRWAQTRFRTLTVVPPGIGICHQLNLEVFADVVSSSDDSHGRLARFDSVVGTDSHTTMINALSVIGWGVGGIEATAAALGQPILIQVPEVVGIRLTGELRSGILASDVALTLASTLREHGVVQRIVEFYGPGLHSLSVPDRGTIANMAPEYGATMAYFPADEQTLSYLTSTGRSRSTAQRARAYLAAQNMLYTSELRDPIYDDGIDIDLSTITQTVSGPSRPHQVFKPNAPRHSEPSPELDSPRRGLRDGDVVIAAITSCTNTSNPKAMVAAGLVARNARRRGLSTAEWTKTSLTPGSQRMAKLLVDTGLQVHLDELGFGVAGFGCGTCMGNSGPLDKPIADAIKDRSLSVAAVLSGNRNFPGRIHPDVASSYLASPPMVVAMAIAGHATFGFRDEPIALDGEGRPVFLHEIWPSNYEIDSILDADDRHPGGMTEIRLSTPEWDALPHPDGDDYEWDTEEGMIRRPPFADPLLTQPMRTGDIIGARPLLILGDGITTDHISPVARILPDSSAGRWLDDRGVAPRDFGSYSARRLNHDVMMRGAFANTRLVNRLAPENQGPWTKIMPERELSSVHEAAATYAHRHVPIVVVAGHSYGAGSARDWAAKATRLLGVQAVIARSFERIHRTNLVAMGVLPIECPDLSPQELDGNETFDIVHLEPGTKVRARVQVAIHTDGAVKRLPGVARIDTEVESEWLDKGGLMAHILS